MGEKKWPLLLLLMHQGWKELGSTDAIREKGHIHVGGELAEVSWNWHMGSLGWGERMGHGGVSCYDIWESGTKSLVLSLCSGVDWQICQRNVFASTARENAMKCILSPINDRLPFVLCGLDRLSPCFNPSWLVKAHKETIDLCSFRYKWLTRLQHWKGALIHAFSV